MISIQNLVGGGPLQGQVTQPGVAGGADALLGSSAWAVP
jgi:hypothetical protein